MKTLHLFDFDGTLIKTDSTKTFYKLISNNLEFILYYYILPIIDIVNYFLFKGDNFIIKKKRFSFFLRYCSITRIKSVLESSDRMIDELLYKDTLKGLRQLKADKHNDLYIVSAGNKLILEKWVIREKLEIITNVPVFENNNFKKFIGFQEYYDCDGIGKSLRIKQEIDLSKYDSIIAYGDSVNDFQMFLLSNRFYYKKLNFTDEL